MKCNLGFRWTCFGEIRGFLIFLVLASFLISGCTQSPRWADPIRLLDDDDGPERVAEDLEDGAYPNLASVPKGPRPSSSQKDRLKVQETLQTDRQTAGFVDPQTQARNSAQAGDFAWMKETGRLAAVVYFQAGSLALDSRDELILRGAAALQKERGGRLLVVGHAGALERATAGTQAPAAAKAEALRLSLERATRVAAALVAWGVNPQAIDIEALADSRPVYYEINDNGAAGNRRAEIFLES
ncbi:MAG: OmpA family protein [Pseudomonadota bacterium]